MSTTRRVSFYCPFCQMATRSVVVQGREERYKNYTRLGVVARLRIRECRRCGNKYETCEVDVAVLELLEDMLDQLGDRFTAREAEESTGVDLQPNGPGSPASLADCESLREAVARLLAGVTGREARLMRLRFGIDCRRVTLEEAARLLDCSVPQAQRHEAKVLRKLRNPSRSEHLRPVMERVLRHADVEPFPALQLAMAAFGVQAGKGHSDDLRSI